MGDIPYIWFRGKRMTPAVRDALLAAEQRAGFDFVVTQGGFNAGGVAASAGTHDGDALDLRTRDLDKAKIARMIEAMRWAGFAAWYRTSTAQYGVRAQGFSTPHVHAVPNGWGLPSTGAKRQADAYRAGRDGLSRNLADVGPGHTRAFVSKTRPERPDTRTELERLIDDMDEKQLRNIIRDEIDKAIDAKIGRVPHVDPMTGEVDSSKPDHAVNTSLRILEQQAARAKVTGYAVRPTVDRIEDAVKDDKPAAVEG